MIDEPENERLAAFQQIFDAEDLDRAAAAAKKGRPLQRLQTKELRAAWAAAFEAWCHDVESAELFARRLDIESELTLRGEKRPFGVVPMVAIEALCASVALPDGDPKDKAAAARRFREHLKQRAAEDGASRRREN